MVDPLSTASAIIQFLTLSQALFVFCKQRYQSAKNAPKELKRIIEVVTSLDKTIRAIKAVIESEEYAENPVHLQTLAVEGPILSCIKHLEEVRSLLGDDNSLNLRGRLGWTSKGPKIEEIIDKLETEKSTLLLQLEVSSLSTIVEVKKILEGMNEAPSKAPKVSDDQIYKWLRAPEQETIHDLVHDRCHPNTGTWFLDSDDYRNWKDRSVIGSLVLHGIPGSGKTVLCSSIIEDLKALCMSGVGFIYAYFYFRFDDSQKRTISYFVRSLIKQLSMRATIPEEVYDLYHSCSYGQEQPTKGQLVKTLLCLLSNSLFERVYIVTDALDESGSSEREELMDLLYNMHASCDKVCFLMTTRDDPDVLDEMPGALPHKRIRLDSNDVNADIELYVKHKLTTNRKLQRFPQGTQEEILSSLTNGADGMYNSPEY